MLVMIMQKKTSPVKGSKNVFNLLQRLCAYLYWYSAIISFDSVVIILVYY